MQYVNPRSNRVNSFKQLYTNEEFKTVLQHRDRLPEFPYLVDAELTNVCNLRCIFCGQQAMTRAKGFMAEDTWKSLVDQCAEYGTPIRIIRWGEPSMHPNIIDYVRYAKSKDINIHITNNGIAVSREQLQSVVDIGVDSLIFSFQGATKEQYEIMRNNKQYDKLKSTVLDLVALRGEKEKPFIHISSSMTNETEAEIDAFVAYWVNIVDSVGVGKTNLSRLSSHQIKSFEALEKLDILRKQETIKKSYRPCSEVYQKLSVDWDGTVTCCCADYDNFLVVGNMNESSLRAIWNTSETLQQFRQLLDKNMHKSLTLCSTCYRIHEAE